MVLGFFFASLQFSLALTLLLLDELFPLSCFQLREKTDSAEFQDPLLVIPGLL